MTLAPLSADIVGLPSLDLQSHIKVLKEETVHFFDLSSHYRAKTALEFGVKMRASNAHIFVVAPEDTGRMRGTVEFLKKSIQHLPNIYDWVYLNNFISAHRPLPFSLPVGKGYKLRASMQDFIDAMREILSKTFSQPTYVNKVNTLMAAVEEDLRLKINEIQEIASTKGLYIETNGEEFTIRELEINDKKNQKKDKIYTSQDVQDLREKIGEVTSVAHLNQRQVNKKIQALKKHEAQKIMAKLIKPLIEEFSVSLGKWLEELQEDILEHVDDFLLEELDTESTINIQERYAVNLLVDNRQHPYPAIVIDPSPTYESLFGSIKYRISPTGYTTDFDMIRPGALHLANGGILVLRAEALASDSSLWNAIKIALRDKVIRIEERHRENSMPMLDAPDPLPIPLDIQIVLVGSPSWYYNFFFNDPDFRSYFRIKADIESDLPATPDNIRVYAQLLYYLTKQQSGKEIEIAALEYLLGYSCRWTNNRERLSSKFEVLVDIVSEANVIAEEKNAPLIQWEDVKQAFYQRRLRNSILEDRSHRDVENNLILIDTEGNKIGQINALTVINTGDHQYGLPNRVSARTYVGREGVINIERLTELGGPLQQKGAMILDGYLNGLFAQQHPVSCNCSLTFEQNYGEVEGDSASLAELIAILSSLSRFPIRQDLAVTGSINQLGQVQAVGGVIHKVEGFFRLCQHRGFTGTQGVVIPKSNMSSLILREEVTNAIRQNQFSIWAVETVEEAVEILMARPAGHLTPEGGYPKGTVFSAVMKQLKDYQKFIDRHHKNP